MKSRVALVLALLASVVVTSCVGHRSPRRSDASETEKIKRRGKLVMLCFPHMDSEFVRPIISRGPTRRIGTPEDFVGFDVDLVLGFAKELGVELEIHSLDEPGYGPLVPALVAGNADLVASSLSITPNRLRQVDFSEPYFVVAPVIVAARGSGIKTVEDLLGGLGVTIRGSSHEEHLLKLGVRSESLEYVDFTSEYFTAILEEAPDFALMDSNAAENGIRNNPGLEIALRLPGDDSYGIAVRKGSDLRERLNDYLKAAEAEGRIEHFKTMHLQPKDQ